MSEHLVEGGAVGQTRQRVTRRARLEDRGELLDVAGCRGGEQPVDERVVRLTGSCGGEHGAQRGDVLDESSDGVALLGPQHPERGRRRGEARLVGVAGHGGGHRVRQRLGDHRRLAAEPVQPGLPPPRRRTGEGQMPHT